MWYQYWAAFYHGNFLVRGGEVAPLHFNETIFASVFYIIGGFVTDVLFREMMFLLSILKQKRDEFHNKIDQAISACDVIELSNDIKSKILDYIIATQVSLSAQEEYEAFQKFISPSLLREVSSSIYYPVISLNPIMKNEENSVEVLVGFLSNIFTTPEEEVIRFGDKSDSMYFLVYGQCGVIVHDRYGEQHCVTMLTPGNHFGEIGVVYNTIRTANVLSLGYCTIAKLTKQDYVTLISMFSHLEEKIKAYAKQYRDP